MTKIEKDLDSIIGALNKLYGEGTVTHFNQAPPNIGRVTTGSLILDLTLGGGYPKGKIIELYGDEGIGKSTFSLHFLSQFEGMTAYIDTEQSLDLEYAKHLGVKIDNMLISQPDYTEQALQVTRELSTQVEALVYDSVAQGSTQREMQTEIGDRKIGDKAFVLNQALRILKATKGKGTLLFINQIRINPNIIYGSNRVTPGGNALKYAADVRIEITRGGWVTKGSGDNAEKLGHYIRCYIRKNRSGRPHQKCLIPLIYDGNGISRSQELLLLGLENGLITKKGSWYSHNGDNIGQGEHNVRSFLEENTEFANNLYNDIMINYETKE